MQLVSYSDLYYNCKNREYIVDKREEIVLLSFELGINKVARFYKMSRNTVKRWRNRYFLGGRDNLYDLSRKPKNSPKKTNKEIVDKIINLSKEKKIKKCRITSTKVYRSLELENDISYETCNKYVKEALGCKRKRKEKKTNGGDISWKNNLKPFERIQIDVKYLTDISNLKPYFKENSLAKYEFTFRDICSGFAIVAYGTEKSVTNTYLFFEKVIYPFLKNIPGLDLKTISFQTDNGSENTNRKRKGPYVGMNKKSCVTNFIEEFFKNHILIIPGHCTAQSDVESFHWIIERECLGWDDITNNDSLLYYSDKFLNWFNNKIRYKKDYSPIQKLEQYFNTKIETPKAVILENFL